MSLFHREAHLDEEELDEETLARGLASADSFIAHERLSHDPNVHSLATRHAEEARKKLRRFLS